MSWKKYEQAAEKGPWPLYWKVLVTVIPMIAILTIVSMAFKVPGLEWMRFYETKKQNIHREVFENTRSYTHGKIQALSKYHYEYQTSTDKEVIAGVIRIQFAEFNADHIQSYKLKQFLINIRGF